MFIIFGTRGRITSSSQADVLKNSCPSCKSDLELKDLKRWFTLFFIPIFPFDTVESFYQCNKCQSSYKRSAKKALMDASKNSDEIEKEAKLLFSKTLVACMTHMANIDGEISRSELDEIKKVKDKFYDFNTELKEVEKKVKSDPDAENYVYSLLRQCSESLTSEAIMSIIGLSARVLKADGRIDKEEEHLLKEYLVVCGIPKDLYNTILEKIN